VPHRRPKKIYKSMLHSDPFEKEENGKKHDFLTEEEEEKKIKTRLKILPVLTREHYTSFLHWV
jgi:hypothetical protein